MYENEMEYADGLFYDSQFADTFHPDDAEYDPETDQVRYFDESGIVLVVDFQTGLVYLEGDPDMGE